ncbi:hypothetical protein FQZ97_1144190 [compost metagenome]
MNTRRACLRFWMATLTARSGAVTRQLVDRYMRSIWAWVSFTDACCDRISWFWQEMTW